VAPVTQASGIVAATIRRRGGRCHRGGGPGTPVTRA